MNDIYSSTETKPRRTITFSAYYEWTCAGMFFLCMICCRPWRLGVDHSLLGSFGMLFIGIASIIGGIERAVLKNGLVLAISIVIFWIFLALHANLVGSSGLSAAFNAAILNSAAAFGCALFFSHSRRSEMFFRIILSFFLASAISTCITYAVQFFSGANWRSLVVAKIPVTDSIFYSRFGDVLFPFSVQYNLSWFRGVELPRITYMLREVGISQAVIGWVCLAAIIAYRQRLPTWMLALLAIALASTLSTMLVVTALLIAMYILYSAKMAKIVKNSLLAIAAIGAVYATVIWANDDTFGVAGKVGTASFLDRSRAIQASLENFSENPLGVGIYSALGTDTAVTFIAQLQEIGILGALFASLIMLFAHYWRGQVGGSMIPYLPIIVAALTSQPLIDVPGFLPFMFVLLVPDTVTAVTGRPFGFGRTHGDEPALRPVSAAP